MRQVSAKAAKKHEARQVARFHKWRRKRPGLIVRTLDFLTRPVVYLFRRIIPHSTVERVLHSNLLLARRWARERTTLRTLGVSDLSELSTAELLHSDRAVRKVHSRAVWLAGTVGFVAGVFGIFALPLGMAAMLNIALRTIHRVGLCYGYPATNEAERLFIYYTLSLAGHRSPQEKAHSLAALRELQTMIAAAPPEPDAPVDASIRQKVFTVAHHDFSREITKQLVDVRILTAIPGIGAIVGIIVDTNYMRSVGWAARHAYQLRWLSERSRLPETVLAEG
jgi:EcsC protein family